MKRKFKISLTILISIIILGPLLYFLIGFYSVFYGEYKANERGARNIEGQKMKQKMFAKIDEQYSHLDKGEKYEKAGQYDLAIQEYKRTIELGEGWMGHSYLADIYEKTGQYELAIKELDWLISQKPRQEVIDEYQARKQKLEDMLKKTAPVNP